MTSCRRRIQASQSQRTGRHGFNHINAFARQACGRELQGSVAKRSGDCYLAIGFVFSCEIFQLALLFGLSFRSQAFDT